MQQAVRVRRKKKKQITQKSALPKTHHEIYSSPATACNSRRDAMSHVPCVSPYSPDSIDAGFVEIGLVQLSQSVKTMNATHTLTDAKTDKKKNGTLYAPPYKQAFLPIGKKRQHYNATQRYSEQLVYVFINPTVAATRKTKNYYPSCRAPPARFGVTLSNLANRP